MKNKNMIVMVVIILAVGAVAFFGGMQYQKSQRGQFAGQFGAAGARGGDTQTGASRQAFRPVTGEVLNMDDKSITVKSMDGSSKIVILSSSTAINKSTTATKTDMKAGDTISVFGTQNSDGSVTAQNIQIGGMLRGR